MGHIHSDVPHPKQKIFIQGKNYIQPAHLEGKTSGDPFADLVRRFNQERKKAWLIVIVVIILLGVALSLPPIWSRVTNGKEAT